MAPSTPVRHAWRVLTGLLAIVGVLFGINALGVYVFNASSWTPELALDLQGGTQIILQAQTTDGAAPDSDQLAQAVITIIRQRVDASGVGEADVATEGGRNIVVQIPGQADDATRQRIQSSAQLQLRPVLFTGSPATSFVGEDGKQHPYPTPDPSCGDPHRVADQRERPRVHHAALQAEFLSYDCATRRPTPPRPRPTSR